MKARLFAILSSLPVTAFALPQSLAICEFELCESSLECGQPATRIDANWDFESRIGNIFPRENEKVPALVLIDEANGTLSMHGFAEGSSHTLTLFGDGSRASYSVHLLPNEGAGPVWVSGTGKCGIGG